MPRASLGGDSIVAEVPHRQTRLAKMVPGARWHARCEVDGHPRQPHFAFPLSWASCVALRGVFGADLEVSPELVEWARRELATRIRPAIELRNETDLTRRIPGFDERLRPYQTQAAAFLVRAKRAILADEMRVGKTIEAIAALRAIDAKPALIVSPNSAKFQWEQQLREWWPEARPIVIRGSLNERRHALAAIADGKADVGIINWEALRLHSKVMGYGSVVALAKCEKHGGDGSTPESRCEVHPRELNEIQFRAFVADEAHRAAHPRSKQARAAWAVAWAAEYRFALTGTPVLDSPADLWALGHLIAPEDFPAKTPWLERYGLVGWNAFGGLEVLGLREDTKAELFSYVDPRFMRRTRQVVMPWLPQKIYVERLVELTPKQRRAYEEMRQEMLSELDEGTTYVTNALAKLTRLRQFASAYGRVDEDGSLKLTLPSCKVEALLEIAEELGGKPAVVFAESKQLINLAGEALQKDGYTVGYVTGDVSDDERARYVTEFQRGDLQFLLVTLGAGGEGLTLDRADVAIFLQRSYSLAKNAQAEDRIVGQSAGPGLEIIDVIACDTVEARVFAALAAKEQITEEVLRDRELYRRMLGE